MKTIWIDLDNTPHIPFFRPIIRELNDKGYSIVVTARDAYQVCDLAEKFGMECQRIGRHYGKNKIMKVVGSLVRAMQMVPMATRERPALALSHGSRSQMIAATLMGIPTVMIYDYEYTKPFPGMHPTCIMVPEVIPDDKIRIEKYHAVYKYPGIKEDVYVPEFQPDPSTENELGIRSDDLIIIVRPPATEAHYFTPESERLFLATIDYLATKPGICMIVLPRNRKQEDFIRMKWPDLCTEGRIKIPANAVNGLDLMWHSDIVISGGGTMNREAAALGVPVYSIFRGKIGAVDQHLSEQGRLVLIESQEDLDRKLILKKRKRNNHVNSNGNDTLHKIVGRIVEFMETNS